MHQHKPTWIQQDPNESFVPAFFGQHKQVETSFPTGGETSLRPSGSVGMWPFRFVLDCLQKFAKQRGCTLAIRGSVGPTSENQSVEFDTKYGCFINRGPHQHWTDLFTTAPSNSHRKLGASVLAVIQLR